jgi:dTDP-4-dehydrorhamnose reductase
MEEGAGLMRILLIGASGFIGHYLLRRLRQNSDYEVTGTYNSRTPQDMDQSWYQLEITDHQRLEQVFSQARPDVVVLLAAIADVGTVERAPARATEVNVDGAAQVARLCTQHHARLIFLSSEYVFSGDRGNYREDDAPDPHTHYGRTKWQAELAVAREASQWSIVRTSVVYGWPLTGRRNLATSIIDRLKNNETYTGDANTYRTPVYVEHLTEGIVELVANNHPGICHIAGDDWMNMYQFACAVAKSLDMDSSLVAPAPVLDNTSAKTGSSEELEQDLRPDILGLDCTQTSQRLGLRAFDVVTGLQEMLA